MTTPPTDGQALVWDDATDTWVPGDAAGGAAATLDELTDVDASTTAAHGQGRCSGCGDATASLWKPGTVSVSMGINALTDVDTVNRGADRRPERCWWDNTAGPAGSLGTISTGDVGLPRADRCRLHDGADERAGPGLQLDQFEMGAELRTC